MTAMLDIFEKLINNKMLMNVLVLPGGVCREPGSAVDGLRGGDSVRGRRRDSLGVQAG